MPRLIVASLSTAFRARIHSLLGGDFDFHFLSDVQGSGEWVGQDCEDCIWIFSSGKSGAESDYYEALTDREPGVLSLLRQGLANKQIAQRLQLSENTVKFHISSIYSKLGVSNRTEALRKGVGLGLVAL